MINNKKVVVGMSGGVDSSVAAALLKKQGYQVIGVFMQFWFPQGEKYGENRCCSLEAHNEAKEVADILGIRIHKLNFGREFKKQIVDEFISEYAGGRTPNPCVNCNKFIKFNLLWKKAQALFGADYLATGHYARISREKINSKSQRVNRPVKGKILRGKDKNKDQTYFLYGIDRKILPHLLFPLGHYSKERVRQLAKDFQLPVYDKKDSQEVCFVGSSVSDFLRKYLKMSPGPIIDMKTQKIIGEHRGLPLYTLGQRSGIGLSGGPWYVVGFDRQKNILSVTKNSSGQELRRKELFCHKVNWLNRPEEFPFECQAQIRYQAKPVGCVISHLGAKLKVHFSVSQRAVMPGQSVVFYQGDELLGGAIILK